MQKQYKTDHDVVDLFNALQNAVGYAEFAWTTKNKIPRLENAIIAILQQTVECCVFIKEYTGHGFAGLS